MVIGSEISELAGFVNKHRIGKSFSSGEVKEMASFILELKNNRYLLFEYQQNSLTVSKEYTYKNARKYLETYLD
jgi:hypothetical protein